MCELTGGRDAANLRLIQTGGLDSRQAMEVNAQAYLYFKYATPLPRNNDGDGCKWQFVFTAKNIEQLEKFKKEKGLGLALVCAHDDIDPGKIEIAFLDAQKIDKLLDFMEKNQQIIYVQQTASNKLVASSKRCDNVALRKNALKNWNP